MAKVAIIGAGAMGLAAAYHAQANGHEVRVYEADVQAGGMAAHFDFDGLSIERFYHFVCKSDIDTFALLDAIGMKDKMRWRPTSMGYFMDDAIHGWGDPLSLLKFPGLSIPAKLRYGLMAFLTTKRKDFSGIEHLTAADWMRAWLGRATYDRLWRRLFDLKFHEYAESVSASWIATRIKRIGNSRRSIFQEELGYIEGGSQALIDRLVTVIREGGGQVRLGDAAREIVTEGSRLKAIRTASAEHQTDYAISTVPTPYVSRLVPGLPAELRSAYDAIENIGVVCVILKLSRPVTPHFWVNISDPAVDIPGFVEFSNLRPLPNAIVYVPYYMPATHPKYRMPDEEIVAEAFDYLRRVNPQLTADSLIASKVGRLRHAQPVCQPDFLDRLPPIQTPIEGLQIADTCYYYPEDRGISESVRLGKLMADKIGRAGGLGP